MGFSQKPPDHAASPSYEANARQIQALGLKLTGGNPTILLPLLRRESALTGFRPLLTTKDVKRLVSKFSYWEAL